MKKLLFILGTRPEAIKLYSPIRKCRENASFLTQVCLTNQHTDLIRPFLEEFGIDVDFSLPVESSNRSLHHIVAKQIQELERVLLKADPDLVIVQGDTTSAFSGALAAHYLKIPVAHVEAGLRTDNLFAPWPEEMHRRLIDQLTSYFFVPTLAAREALLREEISPKAIWVVGNSSIDALSLLKERIPTRSVNGKRSIVVTIHRRENHGDILEGICSALTTVARSVDDVEILFFLHPNPSVQKIVKACLSGVENIHLQQPVDHLTFVEFMAQSAFIITDSGGIQEEGPYLGKPILVVRDTTERPEGLEEGTARLIGTSPDQIVAHCMELLRSPTALASMSKVHHPYGEGNSGSQIATVLEQVLL